MTMMDIKKPIRILHVLPGLTFCGGIEAYLLNYYRHIDHSKIQFDFITHSRVENGIKAEIESLGGRVFDWEAFRISRFFSIRKQISTFFQQHKGEYAILHCHMANAAFLYFPLAKKNGIKHCILHSHNNRAAATRLHAVRNLPLLYIGNREATERIACAEDAGRFLFGQYPFTIIKNSIDVNKFIYSPSMRTAMREQLHLEKNFIIGHVGRLNPQKNQSFLIRIFNALYQKNPEVRLLMIGEGEDETALKQLVQDLQLQRVVKFLGAKRNIEDYYQAFDAFVFPSIYEGLGIVLVEAQCSGLPTFASADVIPNDAKVSDLLTFIPLKNNIDQWAATIEKCIENKIERKSPVKEICDAGYDIRQEAEVLEQYYFSLN